MAAWFGARASRLSSSSKGRPSRKAKGGRIVVDEYLRAADRVFALGDCAASREDPLPPTANAAEQQGAYLAKCFNETYYKSGADGAMPARPDPVRPSAMPFAWLEILDNLWSARQNLDTSSAARWRPWACGAASRTHQVRDHARRRDVDRRDGLSPWRGREKQVSVQNIADTDVLALNIPDARGDGVRSTDAR